MPAATEGAHGGGEGGNAAEGMVPAAEGMDAVVLTTASPQQVTLYSCQLERARDVGCFPASTAAIAIPDRDGPPLLLRGIDLGDNFFFGSGEKRRGFCVVFLLA